MTTSGDEVPGSLPGVADQSTQSIVINAEPKAIMDVIADVRRLSAVALAVKSAEVIVPGVGDRAERLQPRPVIPALWRRPGTQADHQGADPAG